MAQEKSSPTFLKRSLLNGLSGSFAVAVQTVSLTWFHTILDESKKTGHSLKSTTQNLYQNGGVPRFYKGFLPAFRSASLARFGDNSTNAFVLNHFASRNNLQSTSLAIQSAIIWVIASTWRLAIMPFDALDLRSRKEMFELNFKVIGEFKKNLKRIYLKRTRP